MPAPSAPRSRSDIEIAIICALTLEADAIEALFTIHWSEQGVRLGKAAGDPNTYTLGVLGTHNVVLVHMPGMGKTSAASVASSLRHSFGSVKLALVVGVCGGVPHGPKNEDIRLGDVVISDGVIAYVFGTLEPDQFVRKATLKDSLPRPSPEIRSLLNKLRGIVGKRDLRRHLMQYLDHIEQQLGSELSKIPTTAPDNLFPSDYHHKHRTEASCSHCTDGKICSKARESTCEELRCSAARAVVRPRRVDPRPDIHFGLIGSGDMVIKSAVQRDAIAKEEKVIAFEMEGAGVWDQFPCVVIKGVCDYADSHKNKDWQRYAAATAAACTKAFLEHWHGSDSGVESTNIEIDYYPDISNSAPQQSWQQTIAYRPYEEQILTFSSPSNSQNQYSVTEPESLQIYSDPANYQYATAYEYSNTMEPESFGEFQESDTYTCPQCMKIFDAIGWAEHQDNWGEYCKIHKMCFKDWHRHVTEHKHNKRCPFDDCHEPKKDFGSNSSWMRHVSRIHKSAMTGKSYLPVDEADAVRLKEWNGRTAKKKHNCPTCYSKRWPFYHKACPEPADSYDPNTTYEGQIADNNLDYISPDHLSCIE